MSLSECVNRSEKESAVMIECVVHPSAFPDSNQEMAVCEKNSVQNNTFIIITHNLFTVKMQISVDNQLIVWYNMSVACIEAGLFSFSTVSILKTS